MAHVAKDNSRSLHLGSVSRLAPVLLGIRHGEPVADLVPARKMGFPFGIAHEEPLVAPGDDWWQSMSDTEAEDWIEGR